MIWPFAFSVAEWTCVDEECGNKVSWAEHVPVLERDRLVGVRHPECSE